MFKKICLGKYRSHKWSEGQLEGDAHYGETEHAVGTCNRYHHVCIRCGAKLSEWQTGFDSSKALVTWRPRANLVPDKVNPIDERQG